MFCDGCCYERAACEHLVVGQRAISPVSDVFFSELIEFIVSQFLGPSYIGQLIVEHVARVGETSFGGRPEGKNHLEGLSVGGVMILKRMLKKWVGTA
jgi:hypothetical protein